jgi:hypothetical protein
VSPELVRMIRVNAHQAAVGFRRAVQLRAFLRVALAEVATLQARTHRVAAAENPKAESLSGNSETAQQLQQLPHNSTKVFAAVGMATRLKHGRSSECVAVGGAAEDAVVVVPRNTALRIPTDASSDGAVRGRDAVDVGGTFSVLSWNLLADVLLATHVNDTGDTWYPHVTKENADWALTRWPLVCASS